MHFYDVLESFSRSGRHVFTTYDVAKVMGKSTAYASLMLHKSKRVTRIERGKYFIEGATPYEIASNIVFPSYVSLQAGLQYYGLIEQNVIRYSVIALKRRKPISMGAVSIEFIRASRELFFGYESNQNAYVASPEKLFIDCLYFGRTPMGVLSEALKTAIDEKILSVKLVEEHAARIKDAALHRNLASLFGELGIAFGEGLGTANGRSARESRKSRVRI